MDINKLIQSSYGEAKTQNNWHNIEGEQKLEDWHYLISRLTIVTVLKTVWYWQKNRQIDPWKRIEITETDLRDYNQLTFDKGAKSIQWSKDCLFFFFFKYLFSFGNVFSTWDLSLWRTASLYFWCVGSTDAPGHVGILLPWPGIKPTSPALEGRFLTTGPPGKSFKRVLN